jgi:CubicO group peptidase (beta-lactamase class C family)
MKIIEALESGIASGREKGCQLFATRYGDQVACAALGEARRGVPMRDDTLVFWISNAKPVMGVAFGQLVERGLVDLDDRAARHLPEFGHGGKEPITLRDLLTHTAGFRNAWRSWLPSPPFQEVVDVVCRAEQEPGWVAGETSGYNVAGAWTVLAAILEHVDGRSYSEYTRQEIFEPLGMRDCWLGMDAATHAAYGDRMHEMPYLEDGAWRSNPAWGTAEGAAIPRPGGNGYGPVRELVRLYEMLLGGGERAGVRLLTTETARQLTCRHTRGLPDKTFGNLVFDRGIGVVVNSRSYSTRFTWFGSQASDAAFGHQGYFSSVAFADPAHDLAVGLVFSGVREDAEHDARVVEALDALYTELGLARP